MLRKHELRSVVNETVLEWDETVNGNPATGEDLRRLVDQLVENIQEVWFN